MFYFGTPARVFFIRGAPRGGGGTPSEKLALVQETYQAGKTVSLVAREAGITASQLFQWRKAYSDGSLVAVGANEPVVPASEMKEALKRIKQLEAALGRKTLENEILKEAVEYGKSRKWIAHSPLLPGDDQ